MRTKVDASRQLAHNDKINALSHKIFSERRRRSQLRKHPRRTQICVQFHARTQLQQPPFRAHIPWHAVVFRTAHSAQKHAVRFQALFQSFVGKRRAGLFNSLTAHEDLFKFKLMAENIRSALQNRHRLMHHFRTGIVALNHRNAFFHLSASIKKSAKKDRDPH